MNTLYLILYIVAFLFFLFTGLTVARSSVQSTYARTSLALVPLGLAAWVLVPLIFQARHMSG